MSTIFRVEKTSNYTVMSNYHLKDRRLSYKAKGLLSEMLSLPPDWDYTLAGLAVISADGVDSVRTAIRELEKYGYLVRFQRRDERGRMSVNEYTVYENPEQNPNYAPTSENMENPHADSICKADANGSVKPNSPILENTITDKSGVENPNFSDCSSWQKSLPTEPITGFPTAVTSNILNTQELNTHQSNPSINRASAREDGDRTDRIDAKSEIDFDNQEREYYCNVIRENIGYDFLYANRDNPKLKIDIGRINEIVELMVDVVCSKRKTFRVNGEDFPKETVKKRFLELNETHIDYVLTALDKSKSEIRNIRAYLITALYNAPMTMDSYYDAWVKRDLYGG